MDTVQLRTYYNGIHTCTFYEILALGVGDGTMLFVTSPNDWFAL
jgi:hypothetical protein